jgi:hypothetical protein
MVAPSHFQDFVQLGRFVTRFFLSGTPRSSGRTKSVTRHHTRASSHGSVSSQSLSRRTNNSLRRIPHIDISGLSMRYSGSRYNHTRSASRGRLTRHANRQCEAITILQVSSSHALRRSCLLPHPQPRRLQHAFQLQLLVLTRYRRTATRAALPHLLPISQHYRLCKHRRCDQQQDVKALRHRGDEIGQLFRKCFAEGITIGGCDGCNYILEGRCWRNQVMLRFSRVVGYRSGCVVSRRRTWLAQEGKWDRERR